METRWLTEEEQQMWRGYLDSTRLLLRSLDRQLVSDSGLSLSDFEILALLSEAPDRRLRMNALADITVTTRSGVTRAVKRLTDGRGVDVVFDSVGKDTQHGSLASLAVRGILVSFGNSSGPAPAIEPLALSRGGSLFLTRPSLGHYTLTREEFEWRATDILNWIARGELTLHIYKEYPLAEAAQAHRDLEARKTIGKVLLIP